MVLDASGALAWFLPSQATPAADALLDQADRVNFIAPWLFALEFRAVLLRAEARNAMTPAEVVVRIARGLEIVKV